MKIILYKRFVFGIGLLLFVFVSGCATYYQKNRVFQERFVQGEIEEANKTLNKSSKKVKDKDRLLYYFQKGVVLQMLGEYEESNEYLEKAYIFSEDYRKNYAVELASLFTNPMAKPYTGEDHELVLVHYYKALNFLRMQQYEEALVECRRLNNRLNQMNDRYEKRKNRYKRDAFAMNLMGIVYEASGDVNNAFIAYRNAYEAYKEDYREHFNTEVPAQLKKDLLRTAYLNGFTEELEFYGRSFETTYEPRDTPSGELVFFWHNGLGPVKDEWSINFVVVKGQGGMVLFENEERGLSFPFRTGGRGDSSGGLEDLKVVRVAFPTYRERKPYYQSGEIVSGNQTYSLQMGENINEIAHKTLEDRMVRELGNSLLRLALKQASEEVVRKQNKHLGTLLSVLNAVSEKADTRNWQTLPYSISYARVPLKEGENQVTLKTHSPRETRSKEHQFDFHVKKNETVFHSFYTLESLPLNME